LEEARQKAKPLAEKYGRQVVQATANKMPRYESQ
jgi:hypothetical protein